MGQGSFGAALASSLNIGSAIQDTFKGTSTASIGTLGLNAVVMQDHISKQSDNLRQARVGCEKIFDILTRKPLSVNHTKCKYMIIGSKKYREATLKELENDPMKMGGLTREHAENEKYLGDYVSELGCKQSIDNTIKYRMRKLTSKVNDIIMLADSPLMGADGSSSTSINYSSQTIIQL